MLPPPQWKLLSSSWPCPGLSFSYVLIRGRVFVPRRAPRKRSSEEKFEGGLTKRSKHREKEKKKRKRERFTSYFYDWPPHKHSLSYGLFALPKLGFRGALSAIHHLNVSTELALWDGKELLSFSPYFSSLLSLSFSTHALFTDFCKWWPAVRSRAFVRG